MKKNNFVEGTVIATAVIVIVKLLGLLYVIPFYQIVGDQGGDLYSYAYNIYMIFLSISSAGLPDAIAKIISEYNALEMEDAKNRAYMIGKKIISIISITSFLILFIFAEEIGLFIIGNIKGGNTAEDIAFVIRCLSPAVLLIPFLSITKGFLQGHKYISASSMSQLIEQIVRIFVILAGSFLAYKVFRGTLSLAVGIAVSGAFFGGLAAYLYLKRIINKNNLLNESLINMVFCIKPETNTEINKLINEKNSKSECSIIYCNEDYEKKRKKLIHGSMNKCVDTCENELEKYFYIFQCYKDTDCPNGTYPNEEFLECLPDSSRPPPCTIQNVVLGNGNCTLDEIEPKFNDTKISRSEFIGELIYRIKTGSEFALANYVLKYGMVRNKIFDEVYEITTLSDKNLYDNLTYINIQDCENLLKVKNHIDENEELILLKIEYPTDEFKIPIIEYKVFTQNKTELNISDCDCMKFVYSIPVEINETLEYKFNPDSEYNNELCYQFTTENNTDIILYDRRKEFNDANASLCESNCKFLNYFNKRAECECPVKSSFNKFLLEEGASRDNLIFRFKDNHEQMTNFGVLKCFKMLFTKAGFNSNFSSIIYIIFILGNLAAGFYFCISDYKSLYSCIQSMAERLNKAQDKQILKNKNTKQNIITTGNNPPPKIKGENSDSKKQEKDLISVDSEKKNDNTSKFATKINTPSSLIDSKNLIKSGTDRQLSILNKENEDENIIILEKTDMEINMLSYYQAQKKDKRSCVDFYISFLKTRHIIISAFINDYNSFIVKVCFILFVFGISLCANTFFFTDKILHKYYINNGKETFSQSISDHVTSIIISTLIASIIKSAMLIFTFTDVVIIDIKEANTASREEKINQALIKVTSKSTLFFIINFVVMILCWLYVGSFCIVFTNTQMYLLVNGCISFCGVLILPFFYCLLTAAIRMIALNGKNKETLYKFSQFCELI